MRSLWASLLLTLAMFSISEAILLPENVIPSVATTRGKRQATSQCSQTLIPITMTCSTPSPAKRQEVTIAGIPSPAGVVVRDAPTPTCSQVYITSEKCSDASGPDYAGTTMTVPPSNTIPGLPGGTTGTVETAALSAGVCPANTKSPWEVQMTPELRDRILDIANSVCSKNGNPVHARPRQGSEYLNHLQCNFHAMGSKPQQDFIASVKSEIQPKVYYPFNAPSDLDCLPEGWADYPHHEQLVADVVAAFIGYAFDLGWNLWETFNVPAEFGASAMSASSTESESSSGSSSTVYDTAGDPPTKSTSSSSSTTKKPDPGPKQSKTTTTTSSTSSADACPTGIEIDPDEDQGQDGPTPTDQIPIVPIATVTGKLDLPCQAHVDPHNDDCNVCTCSGKDTTLTIPMSHQTYITPVKGSMITTSDACFYTSWPDTKSISTTTCLDGNQIAQSKSIQSAMAEISKHIYPSDYTPGAPIPTCSPDPNHKMPICDLKNGGKDNLPPKYCLCPGPTPSISTPTQQPTPAS